MWRLPCQLGFKKCRWENRPSYRVGGESDLIPDLGVKDDGASTTNTTLIADQVLRGKVFKKRLC